MRNAFKLYPPICSGSVIGNVSEKPMTPAELRLQVNASGPIYKMSLGKNAAYRAEALKNDVLVFGSEKVFHDAVVSGDETRIARAGRLVRTDKYSSGGAPPNAYSVWRATIETFLSLPSRLLILHWEADQNYLYWGLTDGDPILDREETGYWGQQSFVFHRPLVGGWRKTSIGGMPLSNLHPKARDLAINMATLNLIQTDPEYLRSLILDLDTSEWELRPDWQTKAKADGWRPKNHALLKAQKKTSSLVKEAASHFQDEIRRMASTAMSTVAYANGQSVLVNVKVKNTNFTQEQLEEEIAALLEAQNNCCGLTGFKFRQVEKNPHLRMSLDRKDSSFGYVAGNLQVVTRAANFFKSASDEADWVQKANAMEHMAIALQRKRKSELPT